MDAIPLEFYDQAGKAVAYSDDGVHIYLFTGEPVCYLEADGVFSYRGEQLGWFEEGWIRDKDGRCVAFSDKAAGGAKRPERQLIPDRSTRRSRPVRERQDIRSLRPIHSNAWSTTSAKEFFSKLSHAWPGSLKDSNW